jgi:hypothetical protein
VAEAGLNPDEHVPVLEKTAWYAYRRLWKTLRNGMGWEANSNTAYVGDWTRTLAPLLTFRTHSSRRAGPAGRGETRTAPVDV